MASSMIHIAVANEINKKLKGDTHKLLLGAIAPDIAKLVGDPKAKSHFSSEENDNIPNLDIFLNKYKGYLNDDFVIGYYIHLYTDYLWFTYFIENIDYNSTITRIDGAKIECTRDEFVNYLYNDYTNINIKIIDKYNLDLKIFYNDIPSIPNIIKEIPMDKLNVIVDNAGIIIANSMHKKPFLFDIKNVEEFIELSTKLILSKIEELQL